jgi:hypothetical protein
MKIRIKGNSLRYRLTKTDITKLAADGFLEERTEFAGKTFFYCLSSADNNELEANYIDDKIVVKMPRIMMDTFTKTEIVGIENPNGPVSILIEKDFVCIDNTNEDQSDNYPNPQLTCN